MTKQYLGLAIGGPADGQRIAHWATHVDAEAKPVMPLLSRPALDPDTIALEMDLPVQRFRYNWTDCGQIALWLLDGWTIEQALKHMADTIGVTAMADRYEQIVARRKEDARHG